MPSITLTDPVTNTTVASGLIATNNANLRNLLNSGLDPVNLKGNPSLRANDVPVWNGTQFIVPGGTPSASTFLRGDGSWATAGVKTTTSALSGGPPASPSDGDIWIATDVDAARNTRWMFQWSSSLSKWMAVGGPGVWVSGTTAVPSTGVWTTLISFTAVRAGIYQMTGGWYGTVSAAGAGTFDSGVGVNGVVQATTSTLTGPASTSITLAGLPWIVSVTAGQTINLMGFANQTTSGVNQSMSIIPISIT